jgi:hypothetical protein
MGCPGVLNRTEYQFYLCSELVDRFIELDHSVSLPILQVEEGRVDANFELQDDGD